MAINGLERITDKILAEARAEADRITAAAEAEAEKIRCDYAARADAIRASLSDAAQREGNDLIARAKAEATNRKRDRMLAVRSRMVDESFEIAERSLRTMETEKYTELLTGLLAAALLEEAETEEAGRALDGEAVELPTRYEVLLSSRDRDAIGEELIRRATQRLSTKVDAERLSRLALSEETAAINGGFILRAGDVELNCSFALLFAELRERLEGEVTRALFPAEKA